MKRALLFLVVMLVLLGATSAWAQAADRVTLPDDAFSSLEASFRLETFTGMLATVPLTETQVLSFPLEGTGRLFPNLLIDIQERMQIADGLDDMAMIVQSLVDTIQRVKHEYPDFFASGISMDVLYHADDLDFAIAEPEIWLWQASGRGVMFPLYFHAPGQDALLDGMYLAVVRVSDFSSYFALYHISDYIAAYFAHVAVTSQSSVFQANLVNWYIENYVGILGFDFDPVEIAAEEAPESAIAVVEEAEALAPEIVVEPEPTQTPPPQEKPVDKPKEKKDRIGYVVVTASKANVRAENDEKSELVREVRKNFAYDVLEVMENGWYKIKLQTGVGYISPKLVTYTEE